MQGKVISLTELEEICNAARAEGKTIAHCHGCFDLMHPGHIRHFQSAAKIADILVVTLTQDKFVNKGPGRPVYSEQIRAESIASLACVSYVAINQWPTAIETIKIVKPNFYVKGPDYKDQTKDLTNNIGLEEQAVKENGGQLYITDDETMSSTSLINSHFSQLSDTVQRFLENFKQKHTAEKIIQDLEDLNKLKVLVIGDTIIDEYHRCTPIGKSTKSPTISTLFKGGESYAGGSLAIANHLDQFAGQVHLVSLLGGKKSHQELIEEKLSKSITSKFFIRPNTSTPTKRRYLDTYLNVKLFEVTFMDDSPLESELESEIINYLKSTIDSYDFVLVADFGHGLITPNIIKFLADSGKFLSVNAQTNSNNYGFNYITKYPKADFISIDERELRLPFGDAYASVESLIEKLYQHNSCPLIQITLGAHGSSVYTNRKFSHAPAFATSVKDSVGAGDAVLSVTSLCAFAQMPPEVIAFVGNCVGSLAVKILGNEHPVYKKDLTKFIAHFIK
jgi:rfaE bifunctional protein kinase chain/domain/rfaE bifunctional protein nucleotidyltransferase chain/domain